MGRDRYRDPNGAEVLEQLKLILASTQFRGAATQGRLLQYIVDKNLAEEPIQEVHIGDAIFENYDTDSHKVRSNATIVRQKLESYYEDEGKNDIVRIRLLAGASYKVEIIYNQNAAMMKVYATAIAYQQHDTERSRIRARVLFSQVAKSLPHFIPAQVGLLEIELESFVLRRLLPFLGMDAFGEGGGMLWSTISYVLQLDDRCWFAHISLATMYLLYGRWRDSSEEFQKAREIDLHATMTSSAYGMYLASIGRIEEGLTVASEAMLRGPGNMGCRMIRAFLFYATRKFADAEEAMREVVAFDEKRHLGDVIDQLIWYQKGEFRRAFERFGIMLDLEANTIQPATSDDLYKRRTFYYFGLMMMSLVGCGGMTLAKQVMELNSRQSVWKTIRPVQRALSYVALGHDDWALKALKRMFLRQKDFDFALPWMHLLPIFDPLRKYPQFQEMLETLAQRGGWMPDDDD